MQKRAFRHRKLSIPKKIFPVTMTDSLLFMQLVMEEEIDKPKKTHTDGADAEEDPDKTDEDDDDDLDNEEDEDEDDDDDEEEVVA